MNFMFDIIKQKIRQYQDSIFQKTIRAIAQKARLEKKKISFDFGDISYLSTAGESLKNPSATVILMLHGFGAEKETWLGFASYLAPLHPMLIPDLPGHGESSWDSELDYSIHSQANRIYQLLLKLDVSKVHLIAHSMGGAIALRLAHLYPQLIKSMVLISAAGAEIKDGALEKINDFRDLNPLVDVQTRDDFQRLLDICMSKPPYIPKMFFNVMADKKIARFEKDKKIFNDISADLDQSNYLSRLRFPVLILWGDLDQVLDVADADYLYNHLVGSQKIVLTGIGHVPIVEEPQLCSRHTKDFLGMVSN